MNIDINKLKHKLCSLMCAEVKIHPRNGKLFSVETPFNFPDGDPYQIYIKEMAGGIIRLTDMGHTLMHLSYENDIDKFKEGTRGKIFDQIKTEFMIDEIDGEFYIDTQMEEIALNIFRLGQALSKFNDLTFLNRARAESTFYDDLREQIFNLISEENIVENYYYNNIENPTDYPIDFKIEGKYLPLYLFGIANRDKARLTTIVLERLLRSHADFDSLLIFSDIGIIPKADLARLTNAGGEMIASLDAEEDFSRKLLKKAKTN